MKIDLWKEHLILILIIIVTYSLYACSSISKTSYGASYEPTVTRINIQAEYRLADSSWRAKGEHIKSVTIQNAREAETRTKEGGERGEYYMKTFEFNEKGAPYNITLVDFRGLIKDTSVSYSDYGEYTVRMKLNLDNVSPFEIQEYYKRSGRGRVIIDKTDN